MQLNSGYSDSEQDNQEADSHVNKTTHTDTSLPSHHTPHTTTTSRMPFRRRPSSSTSASTERKHPLISSVDDDDDDAHKYIPEQFRSPTPPFPKKSIIYAVSLFLIGSILLIFGSLIFTGIIGSEEGDHRWLSMIILGTLTFIPGAYHTNIAWQAWRGTPGYSYYDIPNFDE